MQTSVTEGKHLLHTTYKTSLVAAMLVSLYLLSSNIALYRIITYNMSDFSVVEQVNPAMQFSWRELLACDIDFSMEGQITVYLIWRQHIIWGPRGQLGTCCEF